MSQQEGFTILAGRWYGWQMMPGYAHWPYFSPILVHRMMPLKTGRGLLGLRFWNVGYAEGVQNFETELRVLKRTADFLVADIVGQPDRAALVSRLSFGWLEHCCPAALKLGQRQPDEDPQSYLDRVFLEGSE
jgi:hypothetical protein